MGHTKQITLQWNLRACSEHRITRPLLHPAGRRLALDPADPRHSSTSMISIKPEACPTLRTITADEIPSAFFEPVDAKAREQALVIVNDVKADGAEGLLKHACKLGDLPEGDRKYSVSKEELKAAYDAAGPELQACAACIVHACARDASTQHRMHVHRRSSSAWPRGCASSPRCSAPPSLRRPWPLRAARPVSSSCRSRALAATRPVDGTRCPNPNPIPNPNPNPHPNANANPDPDPDPSPNPNSNPNPNPNPNPKQVPAALLRDHDVLHGAHGRRRVTRPGVRARARARARARVTPASQHGRGEG